MFPENVPCRLGNKVVIEFAGDTEVDVLGRTRSASLEIVPSRRAGRCTDTMHSKCIGK